MRTRPFDLKGGTRYVAGAVSSSGGLVQGTGFSVVRTSIGHYLITFDKPFRAPPVVVISGTDQVAGNYQAAVDPNPAGISTKSFIVYVSQPGTAYFDVGFTFLAIEQAAA